MHHHPDIISAVASDHRRALADAAAHRRPRHDARAAAPGHSTDRRRTWFGQWSLHWRRRPRGSLTGV